MERRILECDACGGRIAFNPSETAAACVFCGAPALSPSANAETIPDPERYVPITVDADAANAHFQEHVRASWFRPTKLHSASLELRTVLLPAWYVHAELETHYAGLVASGSPSGKAPRAGVDRASLDHLVPASGGLTSAELNELRPFELQHATSWESDAVACSMEIPACTESKARAIAADAFRSHHLAAIAQRERLSSPSASSVIQVRQCELMLLPVHICAVQFRDRPWRVLVNARTGEVLGTLPWDRIKVTMVVLAILFIGTAISLFAQ